MINIFIPIVENVEGFCEFVEKHKEKDKHIYVGIRKSLKEKFVVSNDNVEIHVFDSKSNKEEIINGLQKVERSKGKLLVIRSPLTDEEYTALTTAESEITTLRAHHNKFVTKLKNLARKIVRKFFAFSFFEDISAICYSEFLHELVSACPNLSMATRINKYVGVDIEEIETQTTPVKKDFNKAKNASILTLGVLLFAGSIAGAGCIFAFVEPIRALWVVLVLAMLFVTFTIFAICLVNYTRTVAVGNLEYKAANELEVVPANFEEEKVEEIEEVLTAKKSTKAKTSKTGAKATGKTASVKAGAKASTAKKTKSTSKATATKSTKIASTKTATTKPKTTNNTATKKSATAKPKATSKK